MTIRSRMSLIMDLIEPEHPELFALDLKNCYISLCLHSSLRLASTNINQSAPNLVKIYMTIRSRIILIWDVIGPGRPELFALELKKKKKSNI